MNKTQTVETQRRIQIIISDPRFIGTYKQAETIEEELRRVALKKLNEGGSINKEVNDY